MINSLIPHILCNVSSKKLVSKKSLKVNCNEKSVISKNRKTLDIRKGQFFNNPPSLYVKGSKEEGRSGTRLSKPISASIGPWIFLSKDSVETSGSFLPPPVSRRSITTVLYLSGGGHRDRLSTSNQRRVEDKRKKVGVRTEVVMLVYYFFQFATSKGSRSSSSSSSFVLRLPD